MRFEPLPDSVLETSVSDRFEQVARIYAGRLAIDDGRLAVTYGELANMARAIAARIEIAMHGRPGPIAILLANETRFPAAILGVLATSRACIPLDCDAPAERNRLIAAHATAAGVISTGRLAVQARSLFADLPVIDIEALIIPDLRAKPPCARPDDVAAILYTSGSAGAPKGVYQNHRGVLHDILEAVNGQHISSEDRLALFYSPTVISGFRIALSALLVGAQLHILSPRDLRGAKLVSELQKRRITIFRSVPALFRHVIEALEQNERLNTVRLVVLGGDRVDWTDFDAFRRSCPPNAQFGVHLGATECWTLYLEWFADEQSRTTNGKLPVGRVIGERTVMLVGEDGHIVADGEVGEFVVLSRHLALGYWRDDELTARAFTTRRLDSEQRIYRTGDLGVRRSDGLFEHVGRKDQQIKLSGRRVELAEVEIALASCRGVRDAAVVARPNESGVPRLLAAYCELEPAVTGLLPHHLRVMLAETLPLFMVPRSITILDALPRLPNFKIDREELRRRDRLEREHSSPPVEPNNKIQETLLKIWRDVLNRHDIGCNDDFFLCGGDSLGAVRVLAEVAEVYRVELTIDVLYGPGGTVAGMAKTIEAAGSGVTPLDRRPASTGDKVSSTGTKDLDEVVRRLRLTARNWPGVNIGIGIPIFTLNPQGKLPPIFWCFNVPSEPKEMARVLGPARPIYAMRSLNDVMSDKRDKERFIDALARLYTAEILRLSKSGPYFIGGNCQSGPVAESIAQLLMSQGRGVAQLTLLEYEPKAAYPGRVALFFGAQSVSHNPFFTKVAPEETWKRLHKEVVWDIIPGDHGEYFEMPNLATFMDRFEARLAEAQI